ncbi:hypothetical protein CBR_g6585 [Chara braunii]|uniref:Reverse transcriptase zinc-binding domain-containing protein n=1 Tax=Chara braunii TaxID=69332 RepID=A0A388KKA0_CHABU|nr:hypothetical protein CBR_g6585 [Chara braunii]|eukprot:GBG70457.1 hypothetical protein CBR_g6585 [Chara braunii]
MSMRNWWLRSATPWQWTSSHIQLASGRSSWHRGATLWRRRAPKDKSSQDNSTLRKTRGSKLKPHKTQTMPDLKVSTWNVRGLGDTADRQKKPRLKTWLHDQKVHFLLLQETKLNEDKIQQARDWWKGPQFWAPADDTRGGCAILIHRGLDMEILDHHLDIWGRWIWVQLRLGTEVWTFMTVYAPAERAKRRSFLEELPAIIPRTENLLLVGDFNVTLVPGLDSPTFTPPKTDALMLAALMTEQGLTDTYRTTHPTTSGYTWFSSQTSGDSIPPKRRLDLILAKGSPWESLTTVDCLIEFQSHHRPLVAGFTLPDQLVRGLGTFRLNTDLLSKPGVSKWITTHWSDWQQTKDQFEEEGDWLQMGLRTVTRALDVFSRMQARGRRQQEEECRRMVAEAEEELAKEPIAELYWQRRRDRWLQRLEDLQVEQQVAWAKRAQERGIQTADRLTKETFQRLCPQRQHSLMRELQHPFHVEAPPATDSETIGEYALVYFRDILTSRREPDMSLQQLREEQDLWQHTHTRLSQEAATVLEQPLTAEELQQAVKHMVRGKSPGSDGLPIEFYDMAWEHIGPYLLKLYNQVPEGAILTEDMKLGIITLIYKKDEKSNIRNWRPVSRLNVSYKILAKALSSKMEILLNAARASSRIQGLTLGESDTLLTGAIADDLLLVMEATPESMGEAKTLLDSYCKVSEAQVNWGKSVYFLPMEYSLDGQDKGMNRTPPDISERYLGVQVSLANARPRQQAIVQARVQASLRRCRTAAGTSLLGRVLLINTVVFAQVWFIAVVCLLSKEVLKLLTADATRYLWKPTSQEGQGYITKCSWVKVTSCKQEGGITIIDPRQQNLALLMKWLMKAATQGERRGWQKVLEYLLQQELGLSRKEDIWSCLFMSSNGRRQLHSPTGNACWSAWRTLLPQEQEQPATKEEVLRQNIFDNQRIRDPQGRTFVASATAGNFGRRWVERGVATLADLWNDEEEEWKTEQQLKQQLGRLQCIQDRTMRIQAAVPAEWLQLLKGPKLTTGRWYSSNQQAGQITAYHVTQQLDENTWQAQAWIPQPDPSCSNELQLQGEVALYVGQDLQQIRVHQYTKKGVTHSHLLLKGVPLKYLRLDHLAWSWKTQSDTRIYLHQYTSSFGRRQLLKANALPTVAAAALSRHTTSSQPVTSRELRKLWDQLPDLPSQKMAGVLWLLSHSAIPCAEWLYERGLELETKCRRCGRLHEETLVRLFWECPASKRVWQWWERHWHRFVGTLLNWDETWVMYGNIPSSWFKRKGRGYVAQVIRAVIIWVLWEDRKNIMFKEQWTSDSMLIRKIKTWIRTLIRVDWVRKAARGRSPRRRLWFLVTWARDNQLAAITLNGKLAITPWLYN